MGLSPDCRLYSERKDVNILRAPKFCQIDSAKFSILPNNSIDPGNLNVLDFDRPLATPFRSHYHITFECHWNSEHLETSSRFR